MMWQRYLEPVLILDGLFLKAWALQYLTVNEVEKQNCFGIAFRKGSEGLGGKSVRMDLLSKTTEATT